MRQQPLMAEEALKLPRYIAEISDAVWTACRAAASPGMPGLAAKNIYLTGCGDSYCAAIAMKPAFDAMLGPDTSVEAVRAVDLSRQMADFRLGGDSLAIFVSASGKPSRVIEGAMRAKKAGTTALALTANGEMPLAKQCDITVPVPRPDAPSDVPGVRSYAVSCLSLCYLAVAIGLARGNFSEEKALLYKTRTEEYCGSYEGLLPGMCEEMWALAETYQAYENFDFVGDSADFANVYFAACKFSEAFGGYFSCDDSENWQHVNYFIEATEKIGTAVSISSDSPSRSRLLEVIPVCKRIRRKLLVLTDLDRGLFPEEVTVAKVPSCNLGFVKPIMMHLPLTLLAAYIAELRGEPDDRDFKGAWAIPNDLAASEIVVR